MLHFILEKRLGFVNWGNINYIYISFRQLTFCMFFLQQVGLLSGLLWNVSSSQKLPLLYIKEYVLYISSCLFTNSYLIPKQFNSFHKTGWRESTNERTHERTDVWTDNLTRKSCFLRYTHGMFFYKDDWNIPNWFVNNSFELIYVT